MSVQYICVCFLDYYEFALLTQQILVGVKNHKVFKNVHDYKIFAFSRQKFQL